MLTHSGDKNYPCNVCENSFRQLNHLKTHMLTHSLIKPFECEVCKKRFRRTHHLKTHQLTHTGERHTSVVSVGCYLIRPHTWEPTWEVIQMKKPKHVKYVINFFRVIPCLNYICSCIRVKNAISVITAKNVSLRVVI